MQRTKRIGLVGLGEVCLQRFIPALNALNTDYEVAWTVTAQPKEQALTELTRAEAKISESFAFYKGDSFLKRLPEGADLVMDATPSRYHAHNAELASASGVPFYTEKPSTINNEGINKLTLAVARNPGLLAYFVEYYRDEKGIMLRAALSPNEQMSIALGSWHEQFFVGGIPAKLQGSIDSIGKIVRIVGTGIEDEGMTGELTYKTWINDRDQGGQLLDRSTHLISFVHMLGNRVGEVAVESIRAGICKKLDAAYKEKTGGETPAETYAEVTLRSQHGFPIIFAFGNYSGTNHRALQIEGEHGIVVVNFATQVMHIDSNQFSGSVEIRSDPKYSIIMADLMRRYDDPKLHHEYGLKNSIQTLRTVIEAREMITPANTFYHDAGHIPGAQEVMNMLRI